MPRLARTGGERAGGYELILVSRTGDVLGTATAWRQTDAMLDVSTSPGLGPVGEEMAGGYDNDPVTTKSHASAWMVSGGWSRP